MRSGRLGLRRCGMGVGGVVVAIVMFIDGLHVVIRSGDMSCCCQMVVFAGRVGGSFSHDKHLRKSFKVHEGEITDAIGRRLRAHVLAAAPSDDDLRK